MDRLNILVPQHVPNDEFVVLIEWLVGDGEWVEADQLICVLESSKAAFDLAAAQSGFLFHLRKAGEDVAVGSALGVLSPTKNLPHERAQPAVAASAGQAHGTPTAKAAELMKTHGISADRFPGLEIIRERHVLELIRTSQEHLADESSGRPDRGERESAEAVEPAVAWTISPHSSRQRRLIRTVSESHSTIPHSWISTAVDSRALDRRVEAIRAKTESLVSLTDLVVFAVSRAVSDSRSMNACFAQEGIRFYRNINVGIAMNMENGDLLVPAIPDADRLTVVEIAGRSRQLLKLAMRNKLTPENMAGGTVTVTSLAGTGITQVWPLIVPGQAFIVGIGDALELGGSAIRFLTAAFDHRVMNGSEAGNCLASVHRKMLEDVDG